MLRSRPGGRSQLRQPILCVFRGIRALESKLALEIHAWEMPFELNLRPFQDDLLWLVFGRPRPTKRGSFLIAYQVLHAYLEDLKRMFAVFIHIILDKRMIKDSKGTSSLQLSTELGSATSARSSAHLGSLMSAFDFSHAESSFSPRSGGREASRALRALFWLVSQGSQAVSSLRKCL